MDRDLIFGAYITQNAKPESMASSQSRMNIEPQQLSARKNRAAFVTPNLIGI
jgi:hypothetical protein